MTERMSNEEYRALKQKAKEDVFEMLSDATQSLLITMKLMIQLVGLFHIGLTMEKAFPALPLQNTKAVSGMKSQ